MNKTKFIALLIVISCSTSIAQWLWHNHLPQGNSLTSVSFVDANTDTAVGSTEILLNLKK